MMRVLLGVAVAALVPGPRAVAQQFTDSTLRKAVQFVTEGQGDSARALVRARLAATPRTDSLYPEILFTAGLVAEHLDSALAAFRRVGIEYSDSRWADDALLRTAQLAFASRDLASSRRAADRLLSDYPLSDVRAAAAYWAARVRIEQGEVTEACTYLRQTEAEAGEDLELANRARYYLQRCTGTPQPADVAPAPPPATRPRFAVQIAAVGSAEAADEVMRQAHAAGFASRVTRDGALFKVRVGRYGSRQEAQQAQAELRRKLGGSPFIVEETP
ncbi:MAG TPA: SPOR domain-containing protein [Gemmatimonadales bacterium]|jgi:cell division septation protein DedD